VTSFILWMEKFVANPLWAGVSSLLTIVGIVFAAIYWWVLQRQALRQQRWAQYQNTFELVWNLAGTVPSGLQFAAAYQLTEFKEFSYATVRAIEITLSDKRNADWQQSVDPHLAAVLALLKATNAYRRQARRFRS
jgi:hypothetical protein